MWRHHDEPEETADALGGLLLEALGWLRPEHDKLAVIVEDLEAIAKDLQSRGDDVFEEGGRQRDDVGRICADAFFDLRYTVDRLRAVRGALGR